MKRNIIAQILVLMVLIGGIGYATANIGRFTPTHAIVEPVYCGACHPDQVAELQATTHLPHFAGAVYEIAEEFGADVTQAEAVSGGCMMCHNTWVNREMIHVNGYELKENVSGTGNYQLVLNEISPKATTGGAKHGIAVKLTSGVQTIRLGTNVSGIKVTVADPGTSSLVSGDALVAGTDFNANASLTSVDLVTSTNITDLNNNNGSVDITYTVNNGAQATLKDVWADMSALSPTPGVFYNDKEGRNTCGNSEKGLCHAVEDIVGQNLANKMAENNLKVSGSGVFFQHDMAYTSAEYQAKQVKLCAVCHVNKLPPMDADGVPIRQDVSDIPQVVRVSHGAEVLNTTITTISADWAHKQVQCIRCHSHAGIGDEDAITGVRSN